ncbi:Elongation factor 2 [Pyrenophora seminiperda CCB06]|uniref:Elongation factor 2 n=1 Tax=Pyrenophora seminiperda CCB06 TaxID=1302712 RepID=A0A3M7M266_9PLEO|nr:Elongation factor 2 [Pyrenophora seminiperda CCB06]
MSSPLHTKMQQAAHQNEQLLRGLEETDSAPSQLKQQNAYIVDLDSQIADTTKRVNDLKKKTASELKEHEKYRDSHFRRFAHKASGKKERFAEKAAREEKEYFDAIQAQKSAEDELAYAIQLRDEAEARKKEIATEAQRHSTLQAELDSLYHSIFAGHTPEFPDEDRKERACIAAHTHAQTMTQRLERERHILFLLGQTAVKLSEARQSLDGAYGMSQYDMFGGGTMASMQKRNFLERAESSLQQVRMLQSQVKQVAPKIPALGQLNIAVGSIWSDVVFDNIFTDMQMHDEVKRAIVKVDRAGNRCGEIIRQKEQEEKSLQRDVSEAQSNLQQARQVLQWARESAFRTISGVSGMAGTEPGGEAPPPEYTPPLGPPPGYSG